VREEQLLATRSILELPRSARHEDLAYSESGSLRVERRGKDSRADARTATVVYRAMKDSARRLLFAGSVLGAWLTLLTRRQTALYPTVAEPATELVPASIVLVVIGLAVVGRLLARSTSVVVVSMAFLVGGTALLAAQLGAPLANALEGQVGGDYCGDFCRTAIMARFGSFFAWPPLAAAGLIVLGRWDRHDLAERAERASWTRAWATVTLVFGLLASVVWWRTILPEG
jgi:hypothetical protein